MTSRLTAIAALILAGGLLAGPVTTAGAQSQSEPRLVAETRPDKISVRDAYEQSANQSIVLIDIRTRGEWAETGIPHTALAISMHERGFLQKLDATMRRYRGKPVALICATGGRSHFVQRELRRRGYNNIIDVPEGMLGSRAGAGWLKTGLPTVKP